MRILAFPELPPSLDSQLAALGFLGGDRPQDLAYARKLRKLHVPVSDYYAVYVVEGDQVLARVETILPTFTTQGGAQTVVGIADVVTRPDALRRGYARALLDEVHRRERRQGRMWSFLWTHRTWVAHRLYEQLGYRDVYSPPSALKRLPRSPRPRLATGYTWMRAKLTDTDRLEGLLQAGTRGRLGFVPRSEGSFAFRFRLKWRSPADHRILSFRGRPVGYACLVASDPQFNAVNEVLLESPEHSLPMIAALERSSVDRWLAFESTTFVSDSAEQLRERGYAVYAAHHRTLMAKRLGRTESGRARESPREVCRDPAFSCHRGDMF